MSPKASSTHKIGCYLRVSSRTQKVDGQRSEVERWLVNNGVDIDTVEWFIDRESGTTLRRPEFERLQADVFKGLVRTVVVWKLDRLSRRLRDGVAVLADWADRGVRVIVVSQSLDLAGPVGRMVAAVLLGLAEIETEFRRERQAAGIEVAKRRGTYKGRLPGTTKARPERAIELRGKGLTVAEIATAMGVSERTAARYLVTG